MDEQKKEEAGQACCYSPSGLLTDVLEANGFAVRSLEFYSQSPKRFRLDVELVMDDEILMEMLKGRLEKLIANNCYGEQPLRQ